MPLPPQPMPSLPVTEPTSLPAPLEPPFSLSSTFQSPQFPEGSTPVTFSPSSSSLPVSQIPLMPLNPSVLDTSTQDPPVNASLPFHPSMDQMNPPTNFGVSVHDLSPSSLTLDSLPSIHSPPLPPLGPLLESHSPDPEPVIEKADSGSSQPPSLLPPVTMSVVNPGSMKPLITRSYVSVMGSSAGVVTEEPPLPPPFGNPLPTLSDHSLPQDIPLPPSGNPLPPPSDNPLPQDIPLPPNPFETDPEANSFPSPISPIANCLHVNGVFGETTIEMKPSMTVYNVLVMYINMV